MAEEKKIRTKDIPKKKLKAIEDLANLIKESNSVIIVSIKNLPTRQFQLIKKKLRGDADIRVVKKNIINRAIDAIDKGAMKNLKNYLKEDIAFIFSKLDPFELSSILSKNKSMARAKIGQIVPEEVVIEPGPTELVPGPIISELGGLGIKFAIEDGKINIKEKKAILKAGEEVSEAAASIMGKLDMKPIAVGLEPLIAYDKKEDKIFEEIKIDQEKTVEEMKTFAGRALAFAVKVAYACKDSIKFLLAKAAGEEKVLSDLVKEGGESGGEEETEEAAEEGEAVESGEKAAEEGAEKPAEEKKEEKQENVQQNKTSEEAK